MLEKQVVEAEKLRRQKAAREMRVDMTKGGGMAHKAIKAVQGGKKEWTPPTRTITKPDGQTTSSPMEIQQAFVRIWAEKVFRKDRRKPNWTEFKAKFAEFVPFAQYDGGAPKGQDLYEAITGMGKTVPGLDGWRVKELQALPKEAWDERSTILEMQLRTGKVPESYVHIGTPMMAKVKYTDNALEHRGLAIFIVLWRVESSAWYAKLKLWQEKWIHPEVHGARGGHETLHSAWPAQARIEESILRAKIVAQPPWTIPSSSICSTRTSTWTC